MAGIEIIVVKNKLHHVILKFVIQGHDKQSKHLLNIITRVISEIFYQEKRCKWYRMRVLVSSSLSEN